jgi:hypothetical protein
MMFRNTAVVVSGGNGIREGGAKQSGEADHLRIERLRRSLNGANHPGVLNARLHDRDTDVEGLQFARKRSH